MQITLFGGPSLPCPVPVCDRGQECGLPARKRPRWPLSQAAGGRAAQGGAVVFDGGRNDASSNGTNIGQYLLCKEAQALRREVIR